MINKVINDKKGLHNRISYPMRLLPFNLQETELFLMSKKVNLGRYDYLQLYMAIGGIPHYLDKIIQIVAGRRCLIQEVIFHGEDLHLKRFV